MEASKRSNSNANFISYENTPRSHFAERFANSINGLQYRAPLKRTGAAVDGGVNCSACHRTFALANSDPTGRVQITADNYTPGVKQTIRVTVTHPTASRWGFQLTARTMSDESKTAGTFAPNDVVKIMCDNGSTVGILGPCQSTQLQFAEHLSAPRATRATALHGSALSVTLLNLPLLPLLSWSLCSVRSCASTA